MFNNALKFTLKWEGGYSDHPSDPGGATMKGITQKTYDQWRIGNGKPVIPVRDITMQEVELIYYKQYWQTIRGDELPDVVATVLFDAAVNQGVTRAVKQLQTVLNVTVDGVFGPNTMAMLKKADPFETARQLIQVRKAFYDRLIKARPEMWVFRKGWMNRLAALEQEIK